MGITCEGAPAVASRHEGRSFRDGNARARHGPLQGNSDRCRMPRASHVSSGIGTGLRFSFPLDIIRKMY